MKGIQKHHKQWQVTFGKNLIGCFDTEKEAIAVRTQLEDQYGKPDGDHKKIDGKIFGNLKVVGETGLRDARNSKLMLTYNRKLERYEKHSKASLLSGQSTGGKFPKGSISFDCRTSRYRARIGFKGGVVPLGTFNTELEAKRALNDAVCSMKDGSFDSSKDTNYKSDNKLKHKYLSKHNDGRGYVFSKTYQRIRHRKYCSSLSAALAYRNQWLTDHNLPIPD